VILMKKVKLSDISTITTGNTPSKKNENYYNAKDIYFIKPDEIRSFDSINYLEKSKYYLSERAREKARIVNENSVLVTCIGNIGKLGFITTEEVAFNQQINALKADEKKVTSKYLAYTMLYNQSRLQFIANAPVVPQVNKTQLSNFEVYIHDSLEEQQKIVEILDSIQIVITKREKQLQGLGNLIRSILLDTFGDVRNNPKNYEMKYWEDVLDITNGRNQKKVENKDGMYPIYGSGGIMSYADDWITKENSVIIGRKGNINDPILVEEKFWNVDTAFGLEPNKNYINHHYLFGFCKLFDFERLNRTVTIPSLRKDDLRKIEMPIPPLKLQQEYENKVLKITKTMEKMQASLDEMNTLFDALMQKAFAGELV